MYPQNARTPDPGSESLPAAAIPDRPAVVPHLSLCADDCGPVLPGALDRCGHCAPVLQFGLPAEWLGQGIAHNMDLILGDSIFCSRHRNHRLRRAGAGELEDSL